jgi:hypothetical protein
MMVLLLGACSGGAEQGGQPAPQQEPQKKTPTSASIRAKINYAGGKQAPLAVGVFADNPPTSAPVSFDTTRTPAFPYTAELTAIEPGTWYVIAVLDMPPGGGATLKPGPEDLQVASQKITVAAGDMRDVELTLVDP